MIRSEIQQRYKGFDGYDTIMRSLYVYFEDPAIICSYGRSDLSPEILAKHNGPAEAEGLFDKLKHDYNDPDFVCAKNADIILYGNSFVRRRLNVRFLTDWQNAKLPQGIKEVVTKYKQLYNISLDPKEQKQPRKLTLPSVVTERKMKPRLYKQLDANPGTDLLVEPEDEGDMNDPKQGFSLSRFSKSKKGRSEARGRLFKSHRDHTSGVLVDLERTILEKKTSEKIEISDQKV